METSSWVNFHRILCCLYNFSFRSLKENEAAALFELHERGLDECRLREELEDDSHDQFLNLAYDDVERDLVMEENNFVDESNTPSSV